MRFLLSIKRAGNNPIMRFWYFLSKNGPTQKLTDTDNFVHNLEGDE